MGMCKSKDSILRVDLSTIHLHLWTQIFTINLMTQLTLSNNVTMQVCYQAAHAPCLIQLYGCFISCCSVNTARTGINFSAHA